MGDKMFLGIDPGATTGIAYTDGDRLDHYAWTHDLRPNLVRDYPGGIAYQLYAHILDLGAEYEDAGTPIEAIVTEGGYPISRKGADRLEWLRGAVQMAGAALCVPVYVVAPSTLKKFATGHGGATKADMLRACELTLGIKVEDDNICDAIFLLEWLKRNPNGLPTKAAVKRAAKKRRTKQPNLFPKER
jgi:Holliday junction resolvasome RuvABC endonuclease subunit